MRKSVGLSTLQKSQAFMRDREGFDIALLSDGFWSTRAHFFVSKYRYARCSSVNENAQITFYILPTIGTRELDMYHCLVCFSHRRRAHKLLQGFLGCSEFQDTKVLNQETA
jgi:hypothetical protein